MLLIVLFTTVVYGVLLPTTLLITHFHWPRPDQLRGIMGVCLLAAFEALAWGIFFSLVVKRPLAAICLAIVVGSSFAHLFAWMCSEPPNYFVFESYTRAIPWRGLVAMIVLGADLLIGRLWLHGNELRPRKRHHSHTEDARIAQSPEEIDLTSVLAAKPDRTTGWIRLCWQTWRQSRGLMLLVLLIGPLLVPAVGILLLYLSPAVAAQLVPHDFFIIVPLAALATLVGSFVFLSDQVQHRYRFFVEHNVHPRSVWMARQLPWLLIVALTGICWCVFWGWRTGDFTVIWKVLKLLTQPRALRTLPDYPPFGAWPPIGLMLACIAVSYAAGQWASMFVRSGLMALFIGLLMSAALCGWVSLIEIMAISWLWTVLPVPLILLFATWLRAPDWVRENTSGRARAKAAAVLLVPAAALLLIVPFYRVHQIPGFVPGFNVEAYEKQIAETVDAGRITAELYDRASFMEEPPPREPDREVVEFNFADDFRRPPSPKALNWLHENSRSLEILLEASARGACLFEDPRYGDRSFSIPRNPLIPLILLSGRELESQGKLDEALDRYFAALRCRVQLIDLDWRTFANVPRVFRDFTLWAVQKGQTAARLKSAIDRLAKLRPGDLHFDDELKADYLIATRQLQGTYLDGWLFHAHSYYHLATENLWITLMPWERIRAQRMLNLIVATGLERYRSIVETLEDQSDAASGVVQYLAPYVLPDPTAYDFLAVQYIFPEWLRTWHWPADEALMQKVGWFNSTLPQANGIGEHGEVIAKSLAWFEADRRATIIILALEAYRLEHGALPESLQQLARAYLDKVPDDPYSGKPFVYFPKGIPAPEGTAQLYMVHDEYRRSYSSEIKFGKPCIWCTSPALQWRTMIENESLSEDQRKLRPQEYTFRADRRSILSGCGAWSRGIWFSIPDQQ